MSRKSKSSMTKLRVGEVIRLEPLVSQLPRGIFRVDGVVGDMLMLSVGEIRMGTHKALVKVLERGLPAPASWLSQEVDVLKQSVQSCGCNECRRLLWEKQQELQKTPAPMLQ